MAYLRKSFSGTAVATYITSPVTNVQTTIPVAATTGFPNTATGPFVATLDRGVIGSEEKVLVSSYTLTVLTVTRGYDGTTAVSHAAGVAGQVVCTLDAVTIDDANHFLSLNGTVIGSTSAIGDTAATGTSAAPAAADHKHAREASGLPVASAPADPQSAGVATTVALSDHKHARESYATITGGLAYGSVTPAASAPGDAGTAGTAATPARADHQHPREVAQIALKVVGTAIDGGAPAAPYFEGTGLANVSFTAGVGTLTFPTPFPNGLLSLQATPKIPNATSSTAFGILLGGVINKTSVQLWHAINGSSVTASVDVSYTAVGW